jgi:hypothetical protein
MAVAGIVRYLRLPSGLQPAHRSDFPARSRGQRTRLEGRSPPPTVLVRGGIERLGGRLTELAGGDCARDRPRLSSVPGGQLWLGAGRNS